MIFPRRWTLKRPGLMIPVFFLSLVDVTGQPTWNVPSVSAAGGTFVSRPGVTTGRYNQAGLGWCTQRSLTMHHARPFLMGELGVASLSAQVPYKAGAFGATLTTFGITGYRQSSCWISYGLKIHPAITVGTGLHYWNTSTRDQVGFHMGIGCALGIMVRVGENLMLGGHVLHPVSWSDETEESGTGLMVISAGWSYTFFKTATWHSDLHIAPEGMLQWCQGLEVTVLHSLKILAGLHNHPLSLSGGVSLEHHRWSVTLAAEYLFDTGFTPSASLSYGW